MLVGASNNFETLKWDTLTNLIYHEHVTPPRPGLAHDSDKSDYRGVMCYPCSVTCRSKVFRIFTDEDDTEIFF
jgi:hypothetical protein